MAGVTVTNTAASLQGATLLTTATRTIIQTVITVLGTVVTGTTTIPADNTIPQNTEGTEALTRSITIQNAASRLRITAVCQLSARTATRYLIAALFQDTALDALAAGRFWQQVVDGAGVVTFTHDMAAGSSGATTFKVRIGTDTAATITLNGDNGVGMFGGTLMSSLTVTEYTP